MIHSYKNIVCAALVGASFAACCVLPVDVSALEIGVDEQAGIYDYLDAGAQNLGLIDFRMDDNSDGKRSVRLQIYGLQSLMLSDQTHIYDNMDFSVAPGSVTVSGSGSSGIYKSRLDSKLHFISCSGFSGFSGQIMRSDEFTVTLSFRKSDHQYTRLPSTFYNASNGLSFGVRPSGSCQLFYADLVCSSSYFNNYSYYVPGSMNENANILWYISSDPYEDWRGTLPIQTLQDDSPFLGGYKVIAYSGVISSLPSGTVDTTTPWDYYNNTLLPYIYNNYGDDIDNITDYLIFPDGYQEPVQPTTIPIVYPTMPGFDFGLVEDGTEPEGIETAAYELPQIETKSIGIPVFDFESLNPAEIVAPVSNGLAGIWALVTDILESFGLFPLVTLALLVAVIGAILLLGR